jgi:hypothetical protein
LEFLIFIEDNEAEYKRIQEINFYRSMLKQLRKLSDSDEVVETIDHYLQHIKTNKLISVFDIQEKVFSLINDLNLNLNKEVLFEKLRKLKLDRDEINRQRKEQLQGIETALHSKEA